MELEIHGKYIHKMCAFVNCSTVKIRKSKWSGGVVNKREVRLFTEAVNGGPGNFRAASCEISVKSEAQEVER